MGTTSKTTSSVISLDGPVDSADQYGFDDQTASKVYNLDPIEIKYTGHVHVLHMAL